MRMNRNLCLLTAVAFLTVLVGAGIASHGLAEEGARWQQGAVVTVSGAASDVGVETLKRGGSAVDAAVATAFALAVTYPAAGNIGGGGYMLVVPGDGAAPAVFDFREVAPKAATREMFVDPHSRTPHRRVGVPGTVRGLALAHGRFGRLPWSELVEPAVKLAREGFELDAANAQSINGLLAHSDSARFAALHKAYASPNGKPWQAGDRMVLGDLAVTLAAIRDGGAEAFYSGPIARQIVDEMVRGGGLIGLDDLAEYRAIERQPLRGSYRGHEILAVPPSSSGGTTLIEMLNILENFDLAARDRWSPDTLHLIIEAARRAYRDRACYLGDPAFNDIPGKLLDKGYATTLAAGIDPRRATPSRTLAGEILLAPESEQTTHFSVVDRDRNVVSLTYTLENSYGSRVVVSGAGFLLNDEMNDFNWLPGATDNTGRIGTAPNQVAPGKRMLSSMCPTVVRRDGRTLLVTGSPGGRTIINTVLDVVINVVDYRMDVQSAVDAPRLHHAWLPDRVRYEPALGAQHAAAIEGLRAMGHAFDKPAVQGDAHSLWIDPASGAIVGAADRRISGKASGY